MNAIVAVDGPAGSGKSTVSQALARVLGLDVLDTGAMYRAVTFAVLRAGVDPSAADAAAAIAREMSVEVGERVLVDGVDATREIRGREVTAAVSTVSAHPAVRAEMVRRQRQWAADHGGGVIEGRDIGTVVFPEATVKVFLVADSDVRATRRHGDEADAARGLPVDEVREDMARRDHLDSTRTVAPLRPAEDALVIDTTKMSVDEVVHSVVDAVRGAGRG